MEAGRNLHSPRLFPADRAFLWLLLSIASYPQVHLGTTLTDIGKRRRALVLRAIVAATELEAPRT